MLNRILNAILSGFAEIKTLLKNNPVSNFLEVLKRLDEVTALTKANGEKIDQALSELQQTSVELAEIAKELHDIVVLDQRNNDLLNEILAPAPGPAVRLQFRVIDPVSGTSVLLNTGDSMILDRHTKRHIVISASDADGNAAQIDGNLAVTSNNPAVTIDNITNNGFEFDITAGAVAGSGPISAEGDADLGADTLDISGSLDITVPAGQAVKLSFQVGDAIPVTPPVTPPGVVPDPAVPVPDPTV